MKIYNDENDASRNIYVDDSPKYISKICPFFIRMSLTRMCGSWCPHFHVSKLNDNTTQAIITCSGSPVRIES